MLYTNSGGACFYCMFWNPKGMSAVMLICTAHLRSSFDAILFSLQYLAGVLILREPFLSHWNVAPTLLRRISMAHRWYSTVPTLRHERSASVVS